MPAEVTDLCHRCLRKDPTLRPGAPEAAAVLAAAAGLRVVADERAHAAAAPAVDGEPSAVLIPPAGLRAGSPGTHPGAAKAGPRRRRALVATGAAVVAAGLVAAAFTAGPPAQEHTTAAAASPAAAGTPGADASASAPDATAGAVPSVGTGTTTAGGAPGGGSTTRGGAQPGPQPTGGNPAPTTAPTTPDDQPTPEERILSSVGGSVRAICTTGGLAHLLSWEPAETYQTAKVEAGPATRARIAFKNAEQTVRMTVSCTGGVPSATIGVG